MNILIDSPGFYIVNEPVTAGQVEFTSADGKLRLEEIDEQEGEEPSSKVVWAFSRLEGSTVHAQGAHRGAGGVRQGHGTPSTNA